MPNSEIYWDFSQMYPRTDNLSGGSTFGRMEDENTVVYMTSYGEVAMEIGTNDEMIASFSHLGLTVVYDRDEGLEEVTLRLGEYASCFSESQLKRLPNQGGDVVDVLERLWSNGMNIELTVFLVEDDLEILLVSDDGRETILAKRQNLDLKNGYKSDLWVGNIKLPFLITKEDGVFSIGIGEENEDGYLINTINLNSKVDFEDNILSPHIRDLRNLASKIILN